jgi:hypothetical protein
VRIAAAVGLVTAAVLAPGAAAATGLSVSPLRLTLSGASPAAIEVRNPGGRPLVVAVSRAGFARTLRGRPRVQRVRGAADWLRVRPRRLRLAAHASGTLRLVATPPPNATPGDHPALILLGTRQPGERRVRVLLRVGVIVLVRVPGRIVQRLEPRLLAVRRHGARRLVELVIVNRGNVSERLRPRLELRQRGRKPAVLRARRLELLPHSAGIAEFVYRGPLRGVVAARILQRSFRLRL